MGNSENRVAHRQSLLWELCFSCPPPLRAAGRVADAVSSIYAKACKKKKVPPSSLSHSLVSSSLDTPTPPPSQELENYVHYFVRCNAPAETREKFKLVSYFLFCLLFCVATVRLGVASTITDGLVLLLLAVFE